MELMKFDDKKNVGAFTRKVEVSEGDVNSVVCGFIEGSSNWARVDKSKEVFKERTSEMYLSDFATLVVLQGKTLTFKTEFGEKELTLEKLLNGFQMNAVKRPWDCDIDNADEITYDCIIQYALFDELIYG